MFSVRRCFSLRVNYLSHKTACERKTPIVNWCVWVCLCGAVSACRVFSSKCTNNTYIYSTHICAHASCVCRRVFACVRVMYVVLCRTTAMQCSRNVAAAAYVGGCCCSVCLTPVTCESERYMARWRRDGGVQQELEFSGILGWVLRARRAVGGLGWVRWSTTAAYLHKRINTRVSFEFTHACSRFHGVTDETL